MATSTSREQMQYLRAKGYREITLRELVEFTRLGRQLPAVGGGSPRLLPRRLLYRSPLEYSEVTVQAARAQAEDFSQAFRVAAARPSELTWESFADALDDDFDTPRALAVLHGWRARPSPHFKGQTSQRVRCRRVRAVPAPWLYLA